MLTLALLQHIVTWDHDSCIALPCVVHACYSSMSKLREAPLPLRSPGAPQEVLVMHFRTEPPRRLQRQPSSKARDLQMCQSREHIFFDDSDEGHELRPKLSLIYTRDPCMRFGLREWPWKLFRGLMTILDPNAHF